jgi:hypothetical protein
MNNLFKFKLINYNLTCKSFHKLSFRNFFNPNNLMWKPKQKQKTPKKHGIAWVEFIADPMTRLKIIGGIPINNIILCLLCENGYFNIMVCTRFDTYTLRNLRRWIKMNFFWKLKSKVNAHYTHPKMVDESSFLQSKSSGFKKIKLNDVEVHIFFHFQVHTTIILNFLKNV